jgi:hypothetical protein
MLGTDLCNIWSSCGLGGLGSFQDTSGFKAARLPKIGFVPDTDDASFGFLDPSLVIRGCHLIPAFNEGKTADLLRVSQTAGWWPGDVDDWKAFYVNL